MRIFEVKSVSSGTAANHVKFAQSNSHLVLFWDAFIVSFRMIRGVSKSIGKDSPVDGVEFYLPGGTVACVFESDIKTSYACELASNGGLGHFCASMGRCSGHSDRRQGAFPRRIVTTNIRHGAAFFSKRHA